MSASVRIRHYLDSHGIRYGVVHHAWAVTLEQAAQEAGIPLEQVAKGMLLNDDDGLILAVFPASHHVDFDALRKQMRRNFELAPHETVSSVFKDCEPSAVPPLGDVYGLETIMDETLLANNEIFIAVGESNHFLRIKVGGFQLLQSNAWHMQFTHPVADLLGETPEDTAPAQDIYRKDQAKVAALDTLPLSNLNVRLDKLEQLPAMPEIAHQIMQKASDTNTDVADIAETIELDPSLAAQIIRYAKSPFFGYRGAIYTIQDAITRVLGFDMVTNIAVGIAAGRQFQIPKQGPLGLNAYWQHSLYTAALAQHLAAAMPLKQRPRAGTVYLAGLLHNIGILLLGHYFKAEFFMLNRLAQSRPDTPLQSLERQVTGIDHTEIGARLMHAWNMPEPVLAVIEHHHDDIYAGEHAVYVKLVALANHLLRIHGIGDASSDEIPEDLLESLGLTEDIALDKLQEIIDGREGLDTIVRQLAA